MCTLSKLFLSPGLVYYVDTVYVHIRSDVSDVFMLYFGAHAWNNLEKLYNNLTATSNEQ